MGLNYLVCTLVGAPLPRKQLVITRQWEVPQSNCRCPNNRPDKHAYCPDCARRNNQAPWQLSEQAPHASITRMHGTLDLRAYSGADSTLGPYVLFAPFSAHEAGKGEDCGDDYVYVCGPGGFVSGYADALDTFPLKLPQAPDWAPSAREEVTEYLVKQDILPVKGRARPTPSLDDDSPVTACALYGADMEGAVTDEEFRSAFGVYTFLVPC